MSQEMRRICRSTITCGGYASWRGTEEEQERTDRRTDRERQNERRGMKRGCRVRARVRARTCMSRVYECACAQDNTCMYARGVHTRARQEKREG